MESYKVDKITNLVKELNNASHEYYNNNNSIMSDFDFDKKLDRLKELEDEMGLILSSSPTQNVGYITVKGLNKVQHSTRLLSLDKTKDINEIIKFAEKEDTFTSLKLDGLTTKLVYEDGKLIQASTRGNGEIGEDITHNAKVFKNIPLTISYKEKLVLTGESIIHKDDFALINEKLSDEEKYKTPRNLASGSVRQLDSSIAKDRYLHFYCFNILEGLDSNKKTSRLTLANDLGFTIVPFKTVSSINSNLVPTIMEELKEKAVVMSLPIDGLVVAYDNVEYSKSLGTTSKFYNDGLAFKEFDEMEETILRGIEWQLSRTGQINPVAVFDTVVLDGTDVSRASLSNLSIMKGLDLGIGSRILVSKRNQIIPYVEDNLDRYRNGNNAKISKIIIPERCPSCNHVTAIDSSGSSNFLMCSNELCSSRLINRIKHYASRDCMNIEGLSEATIEKIMSLGILNNFLDIYKLKDHKKEITKLEGFGEKSFNKLIDNIEKSKEVRLSNFISAMGIPNIGQSTSKTIAKHFNYSFKEFYNGLNEGFNFTKLKDCGIIINDGIYKWFNNLEERDIMLKIPKELKFKREDVLSVTQNDNFKDKTFVITGTMRTMKRNDIKKLIEDLGGKVSGSVSKKTNALIYGENAGSKLDKAEELGIKLITEDEFVEMIKI